nr:mature capsid protein gamma [Pariacoto virus]1F8V_D Chain D, MATURE CAPSID PROTEIN GAMMA [Pariacoto virus]1F8V_E Chain E, MATURE CAPSID PROTEIN GAMMA [Pariacoto virus]1F8V_F Chain F, MATURE CAPSID PROTEIN GAMMA [Pariacoto virus]
SKFWEGVLRVLNQISGTLSVIPGPVGTISAGVHQLTGMYM